MRKIRNPSTEIALPGFEVYHDDFLTSRRKELIFLIKAIETSDFKMIYETAHQWKGFSSPYGFQELGELALKIEEAAKNQNHDQCCYLLKDIAAYLGHD